MRIRGAVTTLGPITTSWGGPVGLEAGSAPRVNESEAGRQPRCGWGLLGRAGNLDQSNTKRAWPDHQNQSQQYEAGPGSRGVVMAAGSLGAGPAPRANHSQAEWELHCGWGRSGKLGNPDQSHANGAGPDRATGPISAEGAWPGSPWPAGTAGSRRAAPLGRSAVPGTAGRAQAGVRAGPAASASPRLLPWPGRLSGASGNAPREDALLHSARAGEQFWGASPPRSLRAACSVSQGPGTPGV